MYSGEEHLSINGKQIKETVTSFWQYAYSDLFNSLIRGKFGEFIVASAINGVSADNNESGANNSAYDLLVDNKYRIEVKTSSHVQKWGSSLGQKASSIRFSIAPSLEVATDGNYHEEDAKIRHSDAYVFCEYTCTEKNELELLELEKWNFYVIPTVLLDKLDKGKDNPQKSISLSMLLQIRAAKCCYENLFEIVRKASVYSVLYRDGKDAEWD